MEKIEFEKELLAYLNLPSIPRKEWKEGDMPFEKGVAVIEYYGERLAYAVCKFDPNSGIKRPRVIKTFGTEPFIKIVKVFVVPNYMSNIEDVKDMDLDEQSKKKAEQMLKEAQELETEGTKEDDELKNPKNEYYFDHITNDEEAKAFIRSYNIRNHIKGKIPSTHDGIVMRLAVIFSDTRKASR